ncbi:MAG: RHS repeat-associated core domain-containing protein [Armatimonadetes bacterium]|nr:RHS repeat-associated core domain-containing protein [Armatimonadota bacterium]
MLTNDAAFSNQSTDYQYDSLSRLIRLSHVFMGTQSRKDLARSEFTYDQIGNMETRSDNSGIHTYSYDSLNRLIAAFHPDQPNEEYQYDAIGNRTSSHISASYRYDEANRLLEDDQNLYQWDPNGNLSQKQKKTSLEVTRYTYNGEDQLSRVEVFPNPAAPTPSLSVEYNYDAFGRRITKSANGDIKRFAYDGEDILCETDAAGTIAQTYAHGPGIDEPLAQLGTRTVQDPWGRNWNYDNTFLVPNGLGSIELSYRWWGDPQQTVSEDSFGNRLSVTGSVNHSVSFTGREWDDETGLYYYRARYYDPQVGRFIGEDPIGGFEQSLYAYVGNNPVGWIDPFGLYSYLVFTPGFPPGVGHVAFGIDGDVWSMGRQGSSGAGFFKYPFASYIAQEQKSRWNVQIIVLNTTPEQEDKMRKYLQKRQGPTTFGARSHCGVPVLGALREAGMVVPPENMWSEHLERRAIALTPIELVLSFTLPNSPLRQQYLSGTYAIPANAPFATGPWFGGALAYPAR